LSTFSPKRLKINLGIKAYRERFVEMRPPDEMSKLGPFFSPRDWKIVSQVHKKTAIQTVGGGLRANLIIINRL
jgi:hypothetical protein